MGFSLYSRFLFLNLNRAWLGVSPSSLYTKCIVLSLGLFFSIYSDRITHMSNKSKLSTESYKGVRDFYPEDMAIQNYIFEVWRKTAKSFGYVEYGASILEPAELYRTKSSEEIVNDQMFFVTKNLKGAGSESTGS